MSQRHHIVEIFIGGSQSKLHGELNHCWRASPRICAFILQYNSEQL